MCPENRSRAHHVVWRIRDNPVFRTCGLRQSQKARRREDRARRHARETITSTRGVVRGPGNMAPDELGAFAPEPFGGREGSRIGSARKRTTLSQSISRER